MKYLTYNSLDYKKKNEMIYCHNYFISNLFKGVQSHPDVDQVVSINTNGVPSGMKKQDTWDTSLIFTGFHAPSESYEFFYNQHPRSNKVQVNLTALTIDIQILQELEKGHLVFDDALSLYEHPSMIGFKPHQALDDYLSSKKCSSLKLISQWIPRGTSQKIIVPSMYSSHIKHAGFGLFEDMNFVRFEPAISDHHIITDDELCSIERPYDVFIVGSQIPFIYPFRYLAGNMIKESNLFKVLDTTKYYGTYDSLRTHVFNLLNKTKDNKGENGDIQDIFDFMEVKQYDSYINKITSCKVMISCSSIFGYPLFKYYEAMARGTVLVTTDTRFADEFDFKAGVHYVKCNVNDVVDVTKELVDNDQYRLQIASNAVKLIRDRFSIKGTSDKFINKLMEY
jgi:hypothetical protein